MLVDRIKRSRCPLLVLIILWIVPGACGSPETTEPAAAVFQEVYDSGATRYVGQTPPMSRVETGRWIRYEWARGAEARCMFGRFRTDLRPSESENLLIFLQGGGGCLPTEECRDDTFWFAIPGAFYVDLFAFMRLLEVEGERLANWDLAIIPYCDGSLMAGDADRDMDGDGRVDRRHRGLRNLSAALDVTRAEFPEPRRIVLAGVSGGGFSTIPGTFLVRRAWPGVPIDVLNDSGVGVARAEEPAFIEGLLGYWGVQGFIPPSCVNCTGDGHMTNLIHWQLERDPDLRIAMMSSYEDRTIARGFLGIPRPDFRAALASEMRELSTAFPGRCEHFLWEGRDHTMLLDTLGEKCAGGVPATEWLRSMLESDGWTSAADAGVDEGDLP